MNEIKLSKMEIRNFKGIIEFTLDLNGLNANIFGENGTGKTTLNDAFLWVMFGKDSANRADFDIKPQDKDGKDGKDIHFLETDVTITLLLNGQERIFRKMLVEKWTKKKGQENEEFTGHTTSHWVDLVPCQKKEFVEAISSIIDETAFKLLTNPFYFCTQLKWEERRKILMTICGDVSDQEVIAADKTLEALTDILSGRSIADQKKIIAEKIKKINHDISAVPIKINELSRTLLGDVVDYTQIEVQLQGLRSDLQAVENSMTNANQNALEFLRKQQELYNLTTSMDNRKKEMNAGSMDGMNRAMEEQTKLIGERFRISSKISALKRQIAAALEQAEAADKKTNELREDFKLENRNVFIDPAPGTFICPTCEQSLPEDQRQLKFEKMQDNHAYHKELKIASIRREGTQAANESESFRETLVTSAKELGEQEASNLTIETRIGELDKEIETQKANTYRPDYSSDPSYSEFEAKHQALEKEISTPVEDLGAEMSEKKSSLTQRISALDKTLNNRDVAKKTTARIEELKAEERTLAGQLSDQQKIQFLIEKFIKSKVNLLEETINGRFKLVTWKLFKTNINGGLEELCEAMVNGVSFNSNLNHAARVNAGLDIINVLAAHYDTVAPIFIDFRESVSEIISTGSQVINLIKSQPDKALRVEVAC